MDLFPGCPVNCIILKTSEHLRDENFHYFTGLDKFANQSGFLILRKGKKPVVLASVLEYGNLVKNKNFQTLKISTARDMKLILNKLPRKIGLNFSSTTLTSLKNLRSLAKGKKFVDVDEYLGKTREIKTIEEQKKIKTACRIAEEILDKIVSTVRPGMTEKFIDRKIEEEIKKMDMHSSFPTIVAFGRNSAVPHHVSGPTKIGKGVLLIDMGVVFENYCSDITRTFSVGRASEEVKTAYATVKKAQVESQKIIKPGVPSAAVFNAANNVLKKELNQSMIHSLGHGLGMEVHDYPEGMSDKSKYKLKKDMVLSLEPGYYQDFGIRIEDDFIVGKKALMLTKSPREIIEL